MKNYPDQPGHQHTDTSVLAGQSIAPYAVRLRGECLRLLRKRGPLTSDEIAEALNLSILSVRPRITELRRMGQVRDTGLRRPSSTGHSSAVVEAHVVPGGSPVNRKSLRARVRELEIENAALKAKLAKWGRPSDLERMERLNAVAAGRMRQENLL